MIDLVYDIFRKFWVETFYFTGEKWSHNLRYFKLRMKINYDISSCRGIYELENFNF